MVLLSIGLFQKKKDPLPQDIGILYIFPQIFQWNSIYFFLVNVLGILYFSYFILGNAVDTFDTFITFLVFQKCSWNSILFLNSIPGNVDTFNTFLLNVLGIPNIFFMSILWNFRPFHQLLAQKVCSGHWNSILFFMPFADLRNFRHFPPSCTF